MCTQMAYPPDPSFQSINSIHYYRVSHRHQNKRMNAIIKRAVIAQGIFFLKTNKKLTHTFLHPHISHPSLKPHLHLHNGKTGHDKTGHNKRGQDKTRHLSVKLIFSPIHTKDIKTGTRGNITLSSFILEGTLTVF